MTEVNPTTQHKVLSILNSLDDVMYVPDANRRQRQRITFRHKMIAMLLGCVGDASVDIYTRNISTNGLGFLCRRPFQEGDQFALPIMMKGTPSKMVLCRVTFVHYASGGLHEIGAEFQKAVPDPKNEQFIPRDWYCPVTHPRQVPAQTTSHK